MKIEELLKSIDYKVIDEDDDFKIFKIAAKRHMLYLERKDNVFSLERDLFDYLDNKKIIKPYYDEVIKYLEGSVKNDR